MDSTSKLILLVNNNNEDFIDLRNKLVDDTEPQSATLAGTNQPVQPSFGTNIGNTEFLIDAAHQGPEVPTQVYQRLAEGIHYALAFVDMGLSSSGGGSLETVRRLWQIDPDIQVIICSARLASWEKIAAKLKRPDNVLVLKKPFTAVEIRQLVFVLTAKWDLNRKVQFQIRNLEELVKARTALSERRSIELADSLSLLKATLESTQEGILALRSDGQMLVYNNNFLELWNVSNEWVKSQDSGVLLRRLAEQVKNPHSFLTMIANFCKEPWKGNIKELKLKTNRIFELYSHPYCLENEAVGVVLSFREITERKRLEEQLMHQATHDSLTGLPNRVLLLDRVEQTILRAKRHGQQFALLMMDLDHFKYVNDSLGHNGGDRLLELIAKRLLSFLRESDTVIRFGGDEFVIILSMFTEPETIIPRVEKLLNYLLDPCQLDSLSIEVTASVGISIYPRDGNNLDELLKNADSALYHAKAAGRNTYQFYSPECNDAFLRHVELKKNLRQALERNEFVLHYQPLIKLETNKIIGLEALLRWHHPSLGTIPPNEFIPIAEETRLIIPIGEWVLRTACLQSLQWQKTICSDLSIAVNISSCQIMQPNFVEKVKEILSETGYSPQYLELEITENVLLVNSVIVSKAMAELKAMGVKLSMDDFGVGHASLNYVKCFPFDKIKIDKSFIAGLNSNSNDNNIVEAIINMTKAMGLQVLAEGVETKEQMEFFRMHEGNEIQGYYYSPPLNPKQCDLFLKEKIKR